MDAPGIDAARVEIVTHAARPIRRETVGPVRLDRDAGVGVRAQHARDLIELLPAGALARVFLLYPDPWPKARHQRRRFASPENLGALARAMTAGAELRLATDIADYAEHAREAAAATPGLMLVSPAFG